MSSVYTVTADASQDVIAQAIAQAVACVQGGGLAVIPTDTSYALIADAFHPEALNKLRAVKEYSSTMPLPIAAATIDTIRGVANLSPLAVDLAQAFWPGALTLLTRSQASLSWSVCNIDTALAVRVPHHALAQSVLAGIGPTVMTGAQKAGQPGIAAITEAQSALGDSVDVYLDAGVLPATSSSVVDCTAEHLRLVRSGVLTLADLRTVMPIVIDATASN